MKRRLRIAASVFFAVLTVALCVLWVRSYSRTEGITIIGPFNFGSTVESFAGIARFSIFTDSSQLGIGDWWSSPRTDPSEIGAQFGLYSTPHITYGRLTTAWLPYWFLIPITATVAAVPWLVQLCLRFSLRTLLIVTTLVSVVLGLVAWVAK